MIEKPTRFGQEAPEISNVSLRKVEGTPGRIEQTSRIEFGTGRIRKLIQDRGLKVVWEKSYLCPCRNPRTLAPDSSCKICHGKGIAYQLATNIAMIIQSQEKGVTNGDLGLFESGTAIGTSQMEDRISFRDRISVPDVLILQSVIFDVTEERVEKGMYLSYDVHSLEFVVGKKGELIENKDYTFDLANNRFYPKAHLIGTNVSINMNTVLRYVVIDLLKENRYQYTEMFSEVSTYENLPRKLLLKREDAFVNPEPFSMNIDTGKKLEELEGKEVVEEKMVDPKRPMQSGFFGGAFNG